MENFLALHALKYELEDVERIVSEGLTAFLEKNSEADDAFMAVFKEDLDAGVERFKAGVIQAMVRLRETHDREAYIQYNQMALVNLAGRLLRYADPAQLAAAQVPPSGTIGLSYLALQDFERMLSFLENYFPEYFGLDLRVEASYQRIVSHKIEAGVASLQDSFCALTPDPELLAIAMLPFKQFLEDVGQDISHREITTLKSLHKALLPLPKQNSPDTINASLRMLLHSINFNLVEFFNYCTSDLIRQLNEHEGSDDLQLRVLALFRKNLNQIPVKSGFAFSNMPPLRDALTAWIKEEIDCMTHSEPTLDEIYCVPSNDLPASFRIDIDLTTSQLSYFMNICNDVRLVKNKNKSDVSKFLPRVFNTNYSDNMSHGNVRRKMYGKSDRDRKIVLAWMKTVSDRINNDDGKFDRK